MDYRRLLYDSDCMHVLLFTWGENFLTARDGYVAKSARLYFYEVDHEKKKVDYYKTRQISKEPGAIRNRALWLEWDGTDSHKKELTERAVKIFIAHYNDKIHKLEKDLDDYLCNEKRLKDILRDIQEE